MNIIKIIFALKATVEPQTVNDNKNILIIKSKRKTNKNINKKIDLKNKIEIKDVNNINEKEQNYIKESSTQKMRNMESVDKELNDKNKILNENVLELKDFEINSLEYEQAIILDKRNFVEY